MFTLSTARFSTRIHSFKSIYRYFSTARNAQLDSVDMSYISYKPVQAAPPPLLVMHGLFGSKRNWQSLCKAFTQKTCPERSIIAIDARNHGESPHTDAHTYPHMAEDIKALMQQLNLEKVALLGHSMGGRTAMYFALQYPEMVDKLIVGDVSPVASSPKFSDNLTIFKAMQVIELPKDGPISAARLKCDLQLSKLITDKAVRAFVGTNIKQNPDGSYGWQINLEALLDNYNVMSGFPDTGNKTFDGPTIVISGSKSDYVPKSHQEGIRKLFPNVKFYELEGAGHWVHSDKPNEFLAICLGFLNSQCVP